MTESTMIAANRRPSAFACAQPFEFVSKRKISHLKISPSVPLSGVAVLAFLLLAGCGAVHSSISTQSDGLRTFTVAKAEGGQPILCPAGHTIPAASGTLRRRPRRGPCPGGWAPALRRERVKTAIVNLRWC